MQKKELGPYANEERMPKWLHDQLARGAPVRRKRKIGTDGKLYTEVSVQNEASDLIPVLSKLSAHSPNVQQAYFCHPAVQHIYKMPNEGSFCGYRNIQVLFSYLQGVGVQGHERFGKQVPSILELQDAIEEAWDRGICPLGRLETGGIRDTRKWIGTPEALAIFRLAGIPVEPLTFNTTPDGTAAEGLLDYVEHYFRSATTAKAPIYLQQPGHSLTIVGLEILEDGDRTLLVFDPSFGPSRALRELAQDAKAIRINTRDFAIERHMKIYRKESEKLKRHQAFEILVVV